jgi:hypothetical protein
MKNSIKDLSQKFDNELLIKEKKSLFVNETNEKLFNEIKQKNKKLVDDIKKYIDLNNQLMSDKKELENIILNQEEKIKKLKRVYTQPEESFTHRIMDRSKSILLNKNYSFIPLQNNKDIINTKIIQTKRNSCIQSIPSIGEGFILPTIK